MSPVSSVSPCGFRLCTGLICLDFTDHAGISLGALAKAVYIGGRSDTIEHFDGLFMRSLPECLSKAGAVGQCNLSVLGDELVKYTAEDGHRQS